ncbi:Nucleolar protein 56, partial [Penicillium malachiteum]
MADYLLFESPIGYSLFKVAIKGDVVGNSLKEVQEGVNDLSKFGKMIDLASFLPFENNKQALGEINDISEGVASETLVSFLELNLPKPSKKKKVVLGL